MFKYSEEEIFDDTAKEILKIINGATIEKKSKNNIENGFEMEIIKSELEQVENYCKELKTYFLPKKFKLFKN